MSRTPILDLERPLPHPYPVGHGDLSKKDMVVMLFAVGATALLLFEVFAHASPEFFGKAAQLSRPIDDALDKISLQKPWLAVCMAIAVYPCWFLLAVIHELGHAIGAHLAGFKPLKLRVSNISFDFATSRITWIKEIQGLPTAILHFEYATLTKLRNRLLIALFFGPLANLAASLFIFAIALGRSSTVFYGLCAVAFMSLLLSLNLIPFNWRGTRSDGGRILDLLNRRRVRSSLAQYAVNLQNTKRGTSIGLNSRWLELAGEIHPTSPDARTQLLLYAQLADKDLERAASHFEKALEQAGTMDDTFRESLKVEACVFHGYYRKDAAKAEKWLLTIKSPNTVSEISQIRTRIALAFAKNETSTVMSAWVQGLEVIAGWPESVAKEEYLKSWREWGTEMNCQPATSKILPC